MCLSLHQLKATEPKSHTLTSHWCISSSLYCKNVIHSLLLILFYPCKSSKPTLTREEWNLWHMKICYPWLWTQNDGPRNIFSPYLTKISFIRHVKTIVFNKESNLWNQVVSLRDSEMFHKKELVKPISLKIAIYIWTYKFDKILIILDKYKSLFENNSLICIAWYSKKCVWSHQNAWKIN